MMGHPAGISEGIQMIAEKIIAEKKIIFKLLEAPLPTSNPAQAGKPVPPTSGPLKPNNW
jgi:hypothetical protein